jgi:hypothetical protein
MDNPPPKLLCEPHCSHFACNLPCVAISSRLCCSLFLLRRACKYVNMHLSVKSKSWYTFVKAIEAKQLLPLCCERASRYATRLPAPVRGGHVFGRLSQNIPRLAKSYRPRKRQSSKALSNSRSRCLLQSG